MTTRTTSLLTSATIVAAVLGAAAHSAAADSTADDARAACIQQRREIEAHAQTISDAVGRYNVLQTMPRCSAPSVMRLTDDQLAASLASGISDSEAIAAANAQLAAAADADAAAMHDGSTRSEDTAVSLSVVGALLGPALIGAALVMPNSANSNDPNAGLAESLAIAGVAATVLAPSAGHWYTNDPSVGPIAVRAAGVAVLLGSAVAAVDDSCFFKDPCVEQSQALPTLGIVTGGALLLGGTIYDLATARSSARAYNDAHHLDMHIAPMVSRTATNSTTGLALRGIF